MNRIDETRPFIPVRIAVLTVSDTRTQKTDKSGPLLAGMIEQAGHQLAERAVVEDDAKAIRKQVKKWIKDKEIDVVITTGGTGFTGRDVTPEAVKPLFEKEIDGFSVLFHMLSYQTVGTSTVQSRACGGARGGHLHFLPAGIAGRLRGRLERHPQASIRQPPPPLLVHRGDAAARGAQGRAEEELASSSINDACARSTGWESRGALGRLRRSTSRYSHARDRSARSCAKNRRAIRAADRAAGRHENRSPRLDFRRTGNQRKAARVTHRGESAPYAASIARLTPTTRLRPPILAS